MLEQMMGPQGREGGRGPSCFEDLTTDYVSCLPFPNGETPVVGCSCSRRGERVPYEKSAHKATGLPAGASGRLWARHLAVPAGED